MSRASCWRTNVVILAGLLHVHPHVLAVDEGDQHRVALGDVPPGLLRDAWVPAQAGAAQPRHESCRGRLAIWAAASLVCAVGLEVLSAGGLDLLELAGPLVPAAHVLDDRRGACRAPCSASSLWVLAVAEPVSRMVEV